MADAPVLSFCLSTRVIAETLAAKYGLVASNDGASPYVRHGLFPIGNQGGAPGSYGREHERLAASELAQAWILFNLFQHVSTCAYANAPMREAAGRLSGRPKGWVRGQDPATALFDNDDGSMRFEGEGGVAIPVCHTDLEHTTWGPGISAAASDLLVPITVPIYVPGASAPIAYATNFRALALMGLAFAESSTMGQCRTYRAANYFAVSPDRDIARPMDTLVRLRSIGLCSDEALLASLLATDWLPRVSKAPGFQPYTSAGKLGFQPIDTYAKLGCASYDASVQLENAGETALATIYRTDAARRALWARETLEATPSNDCPYTVFATPAMLAGVNGKPLLSIAGELGPDSFAFDDQGPHGMYTPWLVSILDIGDHLGVAGCATMRDAIVARFASDPQYTSELVGWDRRYLA